jgi:hypothetical protein
MATKTEEFLTGTGTTISFTTQYINESDIKVRVDGGAPLTFIGTTGTPTTGQYKIAANSTTITFGDNQNGKSLHIYSETDVSTPTVSFTPGSSIKAADLQSIETLVRHGIQESRNEIVTADIRDSQITSSKIVDGTIVDGDIASNAAIAQTKIATGTLPSGIQVASANIVNGTIVNDDVSSSANIDGSKIADASIPVAKMASGTLPSNTKITTTNIEDGTIADVDIASNAAISHSKLALNIVNSDINASADIAGSKLADDSVGLSKLGGGALPTDITITSNNIVDGTIVNADIKSDAGIAYTKLQTGVLPADRQVNSANIVDGSIVNADINASADIQGSKLLDDSVTLDKLGAGALPTDITVASANIVDGTIVNADINGSAEIEGSKLLNDSVTLDKLGSGNLPTDINVSDSNIVTGTLDNRYFTETELTSGTALDGRYFTETELLNGALDGRYYTETEAEGKFLRQDSSETIASGVTWSNSDAFVATTAAINARIIDLIDEVGGFTAIANQTSFPTTNPQGATGQSAILSIAATTATLTPSGTTVTIPNGAGTGNTVTITGVPTTIPTGFGFLVESTSTTHTYSFHRLVPVASQINTVAQNITNIVQAGANVTDINNFVDLYQISNSAPTQRADGNSLQVGDLWFDNANDTLRVYDGTNWAIISPSQTVLNDISIVSGAITYQEDLGLISDAVSTGSSNGSLDIVADALEDEITLAVTVVNSGGNKFVIDGDTSNPAKALTLYKGWTYTFDQSDSSNATHPLEFKTDSGSYTTNVTVTGTAGQAGAKVQIVIPESQPTGNFRYYCSVHGNAMGNLITVKDDPIKTVSDNVTSIIAAANNNTNISAVANNNSNITAVANNATNINAVQANATNINAVNANSTNIDAVAGNNANITAVANNSSNINSAVSNASNINAAVANASNINSVVSNATNINTTAANIADVNNFATRYRIGSTNPTTSLDVGDLFFNTSANELRIYNGTQWQGGVTATGNLSQVSGSVFTGDNRYNDNIKVKFGTDSDLQIFHNTTDSIINASGVGNIKLQDSGNTKLEVTSTGVTVTGLMSATTIDGSAGDNLTLDFGTL